ncbi:hypothetical protein GCM10010508_01730 [Streptomyces naganishii JCM 4654]|uniref:Uncharacterized protein n=1 Tax=Streptomyces naganishii JCM 4654 TaxID=1306179 RepID=A0A918XXV0_9ACTN|nr:hypothetical protein GCM10010508_01730 [Streptomyces naganishii JCM 4654]
MTVVVSSDTDIYISPGLYGDCLPTSATGKAADSFRAEHLRSLLSMLVLFMLAQRAAKGTAPTGRARPMRRTRQRRATGGRRLRAGIHVTWTLGPIVKVT